MLEPESSIDTFEQHNSSEVTSMRATGSLDARFNTQLSQVNKAVESDQERARIEKKLTERIPDLSLSELRALIRQMDETLIDDGQES